MTAPASALTPDLVAGLRRLKLGLHPRHCSRGLPDRQDPTVAAG